LEQIGVYDIAIIETIDMFFRSNRLDGGNFAKLFVGSVPRTAVEDDVSYIV